jgi:hypothetical protein
VNHVTRSGPELYATHAIDKEMAMHGIIESLSPENGQIDWKWVGSVFVFYVVVMIGAVGVMITH